MRGEAVADVVRADEAGAAGDQQPHAAASTRLRLALAQVGGEALAPLGSAIASGRSLPSTEYGGRGAGRAEHLGGRRHHPALDARLVEDLLGELVPRALPRGRRCGGCRTPRPRSARAIASARCARVGRAADLVARPPGPRAARRPSRSIVSTKFLPPTPEQPRGADDEVARVGDRDRGLAGELGAAVGRQRAGVVGLDVGRAPRRRRRRSRSRGRRPSRRPSAAAAATIAGASPLSAHRLGLVVLGAVDVGPGGAVDDHVGPSPAERRVRRRAAVGDVEVSCPRAAARPRGRGRAGERHVAAQHPAAPGDQDPHRDRDLRVVADDHPQGLRQAVAARELRRCGPAGSPPCARRGRRRCEPASRIECSTSER